MSLWWKRTTFIRWMHRAEQRLLFAEGILEYRPQGINGWRGTLVAPDGSVSGNTVYVPDELPVSSVREGEAPGIHTICYDSRQTVFRLPMMQRIVKGFVLVQFWLPNIRLSTKDFRYEWFISILEYDKSNTHNGLFVIVLVLWLVFRFIEKLAGTGGSAVYLRCVYYEEDILDLVEKVKESHRGDRDGVGRCYRFFAFRWQFTSWICISSRIMWFLFFTGKVITGGWLSVCQQVELWSPRTADSLHMPLAQHTLPVFNCKSYLEFPQWDYKRVKGLGDVQLNDIVVFNFLPEIRWWQMCPMMIFIVSYQAGKELTKPVDMTEWPPNSSGWCLIIIIRQAVNISMRMPVLMAKWLPAP